MPEKLLTIFAVEDMVGFKKTKIFELIKKGEFPQNRNIKGKKLWLLSDIQEWITEQIQQAS